MDYREFPGKSLIREVKDDLQEFLSNDSDYEDVWERMFGKIFNDWSIFAYENGFAMENGFWKWPKSMLPAENYSFALWDLYCTFAALSRFLCQTSYPLQVLSSSTYCHSSAAAEVSWPKEKS